jgi:hypothetical protein
MNIPKAKSGKIITALLIIISLHAVGQENYLPGFIIKMNGDTATGFIDYRNWSVNPNSIYFKSEISSSRVKYNALSISAFAVADELYVSAIIITEVSPTKISDLEKTAELKFSTDTTFLQTLYNGKKSLYYYKNSYGKEQFYFKQGSLYELLIYKQYLKVKPEDGSKSVAENNRYIGQLSIYLNDCPTIQQKLSSAQYHKTSLANIFKYYYECTQSATEFQKDIEKITAKFGILGGMTLSTIKYTSSGYPYLENTDYNYSANPSIGISLNLIFPRNRNKWSLNNELIFSTFLVSGYCDEYKNPNEYRYTSTTIGNSHIKLNNMLRYKVPVKNLFLFFNAGISNGILINETNQMTQRSKYYSSERIVEGDAYGDIRKWEFGLNLGAGTAYKKFSFEFRYEYGNGNSEPKYLAMSTTRFYFLLGYYF